MRGSPSPAVRWVRGGRILANMSQGAGDSVKYVIRERVSRHGDSVTVNSSLIIRNVTLGDLDNYSCVAINTGGMAESRAQVALHEAAVWAELAQVSCDWRRAVT